MKRKQAIKRVDWDGLDLELLREWWADETKEPNEFSNRFGVCYERILANRKRLGLPPRKFRYRQYVDDPTPEEIAERAAECRQRHYEQVRLHGKAEPQPGRMMCDSGARDLTPRIFCGGMI